MITKSQVSGRRVFVGLSGGVDSAVAAALLQEAGAQVTGVFIKGWYPPGMPCTWAGDRRDAMRVAAHLHIPFHTLDASAEYKHGVIDYLLAEYWAGRTPNPDVMCNREVKFGAFYTYAVEQGADYIATGHYARRNSAATGSPLVRGADTAKDQSYFLWAVPREALGRSLFPLGDLTKPDVRGLARRYGLPTAEKPDSQGICFLGAVSVEDFLRGEFDSRPGVAIDETGERIGTHGGALFYTLGERIALGETREPGPWYIVAKDIAGNRLTVSKKRVAEHETPQKLSFRDANWLTTPKQDDDRVIAQYRYHGPLVAGHVQKNVFHPAMATREPAAPGQSIVFYQGDQLLGGGILA